MSASQALQRMIVAVLKADAAVSAVMGARVYDEAPTDAVFPMIEIGASDFRPDDDIGDGSGPCIVGREETVQIDVWHRDQGRRGPCRASVDAVYAALHRADAALDDPYALVAITVELARVMGDPDGITAHGVVQVTAVVEDRS